MSAVCRNEAILPASVAEERRVCAVVGVVEECAD